MREILISRVVSYDKYNNCEVETNWHTSKEWCEDWIDKSSTKDMLQIETDVLIFDNESHGRN